MSVLSCSSADLVICLAHRTACASVVAPLHRPAEQPQVVRGKAHSRLQGGMRFCGYMYMHVHVTEMPRFDVRHASWRVRHHCNCVKPPTHYSCIGYALDLRRSVTVSE